jgi:hypothetical protein
MGVAYRYLMRDDPRVVEVAPKYAAYWQGLGLPGYEGGPFVDRSGGLIVLECHSLDDARRYVSSDPFVAHDLLHASWLKQWSVETYPFIANPVCGFSW